MAKKAILTVHDKTGLPELARALSEHGYELIASTRTRTRVQTEAGIVPIWIEDYVKDQLGIPDTLGRAESLQVLANRLSTPYEPEIRVVICNFRPIERRNGEIVSDPDGPQLVCSAVVSNRLVVVDPNDYEELIALLDDSPGLAVFQSEMREKALKVKAAYAAQVRSHLRRLEQKPAHGGWGPAAA